MAISLDEALTNYGNSGQQAVDTNAIGTIAPYVTSLSKPIAPVQQSQISTPTNTGSGIGKFGHWIANTAGEIGDVSKQAASWLINTNKNILTSVPREISGIYHGQMDNTKIDWYSQRSQANSAKLQALSTSFKQGRISRADYQAQLQSLIKDNNNLIKGQDTLSKTIALDQSNAYKAMVDSASLAVTIMTGGEAEALSLLSSDVAKELPGVLGMTMKDAIGLKTTAEYLSGVNANAMLGNVEQALTKFATDPASFGDLSSGMKLSLQKASAEIMANGTKDMTSAEIGRAMAANFALKYPLQYSYLSSTGHSLYQELNQDKYGAAMKNLGFNALLMLSGGPMGFAMKYGKGALGKVSAATFERSTFVDTLGTTFKENSTEAVYRYLSTQKDFSDYKFFQNGKIVTLDSKAAMDRLVQNIHDTEAINMVGKAKNDPAGAAIRLANGMEAYEGISMRNFTTHEALVNMNNFAEAQRIADFYGNGRTTVGRVAPWDIQNIVKQVSPKLGANRQTAHDTLTELINANVGNKAWANNDNFIRQVRALIDKYPNGKKFAAAMKNIKAQSSLKDFPKDIAKQLGKMGYIPISPGKLEAPYVQGRTGPLLSKYAQEGDEFFNRAVQPLPGLGHFGTALTMMGVSPLSSEDASYRMYNGALAERLSKVPLKGKLVGENGLETADNITKKLSSWAAKLNKGQVQRGGLNLAGHRIRPPIQDLKMLLDKDIAAALKVDQSTAHDIGQAIRNAALDIPLATRGLGDRAVDVLNNIPLFRSYIRIQGAGRFAWNPFFEAKVATKTELAAQLRSGGKMPVVLENIVGKGPAIESTRQLMRDEGRFSTQSGGLREVTAGTEAESSGTAITGESLNRKLLPVQERTIAGMVNKMADKVGLTPSQFLEQFPQQVKDEVSMIAHYDARSSFLHSPMVRTLNFAFFPFRFEAKVASIMAQSLAERSMLTQVAVISGLMNAHTWLNSPEGMAWYSKNSNVIKFLTYFSPVTTLSTFYNSIDAGIHGDLKDVANNWELGGLPLGFIPQILNDEGLNIQPGYVNPSTGQATPKEVPITARAQLQVAVGDLLGSLFTYPGAELGLPSKTSVDKFIGGSFTGGKAPTSEFNPTQPPLSSQTQKFQQTIGGTPTNKATQQTQAPPQTPQNITVPATGSGTAAPVYKSGSPKTPKLKKGQFKAQKPVL